MKKAAALLVVLALPLAACGSAPRPDAFASDPAPAYSALGFWDAAITPTGTTEQYSIGMNITTQEKDGDLTGAWEYPSLDARGMLNGNVSTGDVTLSFINDQGYIIFKGAFSGNTFTGTYTAFVVGAQQAIGTAVLQETTGTTVWTRR